MLATWKKVKGPPSLLLLKLTPTEIKYETVIENITTWVIVFEAFPGGSVIKNPPTNVGDAGSIPE